MEKKMQDAEMAANVGREYAFKHHMGEGKYGYENFDDNFNRY